jgi:hypothetical protein
LLHTKHLNHPRLRPARLDGTAGMFANALRNARKRQRLTDPITLVATPVPYPARGHHHRHVSVLPAKQVQTRCAATAAAAWRPVSVLDEYGLFLSLIYLVTFLKKKHALANELRCRSWVAREARPISLRQLMVFGRSLTEARLISSANYVRTELPVR